MSLASMDLSIVIPCFNEAKNVSLVLEQLQSLLESSKDSVEVIVIDGGSTDDTPNELKHIFQSLPSSNFKLILKESRGGYGADINYALGKARGSVLAWTHADLQTDPADLLKAFDAYKNYTKQKIIVKGKRKNRKFLELFFTIGMQLVVLLIIRQYLSDINAQPKIFSRDFYMKHIQKQAPHDFSLDLFLLYQAKKYGYGIKEIPVYFKQRLHGEAKGGGSWRTRLLLIKRTLQYIIKFKSLS